MGNCNSESEIKQKCTGCGYKKCDCTAGLDRLCGRCDPSWKYNIPGTYDAQYNAWMAANPRPVKPVFDPQPALNSMDFVCTQCTQCQDFSGITGGGSVNITDPSQVMTCIGKMQDKAADAANAKALADAKAAADAANAAINTQSQQPQQPQQSTQVQAPVMNQTMIMMFMVMLILIIAVAMIMQKGSSDKVGSSDQYDTYPQNVM